MSERKGDWIQTYTGRKFWPLDPRPEEIHIADIAHALGNTCRFGGHCHLFYSVAQHSVYVSREARPENRLWGLLHDAAEAYLVDLPSPIKRQPEMQYLREAEDRILVAVAQAFGLPPEIPDEVKHIDRRMLMTEARDLHHGPTNDEWVQTEVAFPWSVRPVGPRAARLIFLNEFRRLQQIRHPRTEARL